MACNAAGIIQCPSNAQSIDLPSVSTTATLRTTYIFVRLKDEDGRSDEDMHFEHFRVVLEYMNIHFKRVYLSLVLVLSNYRSSVVMLVNTVCADPEKVKAIVEW
ncbi:hypothetical protein Plhal304r1_c054g0139411 [Plasmopara halstedii]